VLGRPLPTRTFTVASVCRPRREPRPPRRRLRCSPRLTPAAASNHGPVQPRAAFFTNRSNDRLGRLELVPGVPPGPAPRWRIFAIKAPGRGVDVVLGGSSPGSCSDPTVSLTRMRRSLPTASGLMCSVAAGQLAHGVGVHPAPCGRKRRWRPTNGWARAGKFHVRHPRRRTATAKLRQPPARLSGPQHVALLSFQPQVGDRR